MSSRLSLISSIDPRKVQVIRTLGLIAVIWTISDIGYYFLFPIFGLKPNYNVSPVAASLYYGLWIAIAVAAFRDRYRGWRPFENRRSTYILLPLAFAVATVFANYAFSVLPSIRWLGPGDGPDVVLATPWYFLPKTIEILFQQLLLVAMVRGLSAEQCGIWTMSMCCAALFGGTHLLLGFDGVPVLYVIRFTIVAAAFGLVFPYLILRVRNGFAYSFATQWGYYALTVVMAHTLSPYVTIVTTPSS
jgi:hypothetical protein